MKEYEGYKICGEQIEELNELLKEVIKYLKELTGGKNNEK